MFLFLTDCGKEDPPQILITVLNDLHKQDFVSNETWRMITECVNYGNAEHESNIKDKSDCQRIYVQFVDYKELEVHENFTDDAEIAEMLEGNASESRNELTNLKEYIIYTKESQNQTEIDYITDEILTPECLNLVDDTVGSKDPLLNIFREPLQQNEIMRVIKKNLVMNCLDEQQEPERQYIILTNIIGNNSDVHAGAAAAIAITSYLLQ